jgi:hypothetical protein
MHRRRNHSPTAFVDEFFDRETAQRKMIFLAEFPKSFDRALDLLLPGPYRTRLKTLTNGLDAKVYDFDSISYQAGTDRFADNALLFGPECHVHRILFVLLLRSEARQGRYGQAGLNAPMPGSPPRRVGMMCLS